jgi:hypothetical protein
MLHNYINICLIEIIPNLKDNIDHFSIFYVGTGFPKFIQNLYILTMVKTDDAGTSFEKDSFFTAISGPREKLLEASVK